MQSVEIQNIDSILCLIHLILIGRTPSFKIYLQYVNDLFEKNFVLISLPSLKNFDFEEDVKCRIYFQLDNLIKNLNKWTVLFLFYYCIIKFWVAPSTVIVMARERGSRLFFLQTRWPLIVWPGKNTSKFMNMQANNARLSENLILYI